MSLTPVILPSLSVVGDSGGPLIVKESDGDQDVQVGVVSWGVGCADEVFPTVYAVSASWEFFMGVVSVYELR